MAALGYSHLVYDLTRPLVGQQKPSGGLFIAHLEAGRELDRALSEWLITALTGGRGLPAYLKAIKRNARPRKDYSIEWLEPQGQR
jgi:hypothetical protein